MTEVSEADLYKRSIVWIEDYFDEDHEIPWNYVRRSDDGRYEAIALYLVDDLRKDHHGVVNERLVGIYDTEQDAVKALKAHIKIASLADRLDFNTPTKH